MRCQALGNLGVEFLLKLQRFPFFCPAYFVIHVHDPQDQIIILPFVHIDHAHLMIYLPPFQKQTVYDIFHFAFGNLFLQPFLPQVFTHLRPVLFIYDLFQIFLRRSKKVRACGFYIQGMIRRIHVIPVIGIRDHIYIENVYIIDQQGLGNPAEDQFSIDHTHLPPILNYTLT